MSTSLPARFAHSVLNRLAGRPLAIFLVMGLSAGAGTLLTVDLLHLVYSNADFILNYGLMALLDGALLQALELMVYGWLALVCYVVFKCCEKLIVEALLHPPE